MKGVTRALVSCTFFLTFIALADEHDVPRIAFEKAYPAGAPNVLVVLLDDVGFAATSTFGGAIPTPNLDELAAGGLRFNRFHSTAMCSPTRAALLTGRNHHRVNMGTITNVAVNEPGYSSILPKSAATIGRVLQQHGYSTGWFGKNHVTPEWEKTPAGPFDRWPGGLGFDYFYGFMNGATHQWSPQLVENNRYIDTPKRADYILDKDLADHLIGWVRQVSYSDPQKPFFAYLASGTVHEPHHAPKAWIDKFKGKFDSGWDVLRQETFRRQKALGIIPKDALLTPRPEFIPPWDSLGRDEKIVYSRMMEVAAAQIAHLDFQFGRIVAELKKSGKWQNTLVIFIGGDNGASAEGGPTGSLVGLLNYAEQDTAYFLSKLDDFGGPRSAENYPVGWAWATVTPFRYFKRYASHLGGMRDSLVISWPGKINEPGGVRSQFAHVTDIAPTVYDAVGIVPPREVDGVQQMKFDGVSLLYTLNNPNAVSRHSSQYFEMLQNRAMYKDGWLASTTPYARPWEKGAKTPAPKDWQWELYNLEQDYSQANDLSGAYPEKLAELKAAFTRTLAENGSRVLEYGLGPRINSELRPYPTAGRDHFVFRRSESPLPDESFPDIKNREWVLTAEITVKNQSENGTIISQGGWPDGWGLYVLDGIPTFLYRAEPSPLAILTHSYKMIPGNHTIRLHMVPENNVRGGPFSANLSVDGENPVKIRIPRTAPNFFGAVGVGLGREVGSMVIDDRELPFAYEGVIENIVVDFP